TQHAFLDAFFSSTHLPSRFYLSGGTALSAFYLKHRRSDDLDFFTLDQQALADAGRLLEDSAGRTGLAVTDVKTADTIVQFFLEGDRHPAHPLKKVDVVLDTHPHVAVERFGPYLVDSLLDIAANKVSAIFRLDTKDFIDLYFVLKSRPFTVDDLIPLAKQKLLGFHEFDLAGCFAQFPSLAGRARFVERYMVERVDLDDVEEFFRKLSRDLFAWYPPPTIL
ncbi:MAG: nucleotidyl transferase AbiEii/AbiGii toxin family protein, partial [candidate division NC10 bacterium]|nr:nucleotidyl transferase AbiEii/AbiGii toxin family protein [candidate division NC10 bacterium]